MNRLESSYVEHILDENAIEKLLVNDWESGLRLTTVPQAMHRLGFADDVESRWRIAGGLYDHWQSTLGSPEKLQEVASAIGLKSSSETETLSQHWQKQVVTWGLASILLTDNEKLIARHIWARHRQELVLPVPENIEVSLEIPTHEVYDGVQMLARLGFLSVQESQSISGYTLAEDADRFHEGLGFTFHTVTLEDDEQFGIP